MKKVKYEKKKDLKKSISTIRVPQTRAVLHTIFGAISIYETIRVSERLSITPVANSILVTVGQKEI